MFPMHWIAKIFKAKNHYTRLIICVKSFVVRSTTGPQYIRDRRQTDDRHFVAKGQGFKLTA